MKKVVLHFNRDLMFICFILLKKNPNWPSDWSQYLYVIRVSSNQFGYLFRLIVMYIIRILLSLDTLLLINFLIHAASTITLTN